MNIIFQDPNSWKKKNLEKTRNYSSITQVTNKSRNNSNNLIPKDQIKHATQAPVPNKSLISLATGLFDLAETQIYKRERKKEKNYSLCPRR